MTIGKTVPEQQSSADTADGKEKDMFESHYAESFDAPWGAKAVRARYGEPRLHGYEATVVADTTDSVSGQRLVTLIARFPRCILPEVNTHRVFSRNSASSRARSVRTTISGVMDDPYVPLFTRNHKGMSGGFLEGEELEHARELWLRARDSAVQSELSLLLGDRYDGGPASKWEEYIDAYYRDIYHGDPLPGVPSVHKQNANRLIEPFMWHEALITSSYWDNFFKLRISDKAQPEMHALAVLMKTAMDASTSVDSPVHSPFVPHEHHVGEPLKAITDDFTASASECARISYKDRSAIGLSKTGSDLGERMLRDGHMSPFEHQAISRALFESEYPNAIHDDGNLSGNLSDGWIQYRHIIA